MRFPQRVPCTRTPLPYTGWGVGNSVALVLCPWGKHAENTRKTQGKHGEKHGETWGENGERMVRDGKTRGDTERDMDK